MSRNEALRKYNLEDAELIQQADSLYNRITRDAADFATRGVDSQRLSALQTARDAFDNFPTDFELQGLVITATATKNASRQALEVLLRTIRNMADAKYGQTGIYKTFGFDDMSNNSDANMVRLGKRVARMVQMPQAVLSTEGFTPAMLTDLNTKTQQLDTDIDAMEATVETRDIQTQVRVQLGNTLYEQVAGLSNIGRALYADTNEAKYNDYVLYGSANSSANTTNGGVSPVNNP